MPATKRIIRGPAGTRRVATEGYVTPNATFTPNGWGSINAAVERELREAENQETAAGEARRAALTPAPAVVDEARIRAAMEAAIARRLRTPRYL